MKEQIRYTVVGTDFHQLEELADGAHFANEGDPIYVIVLHDGSQHLINLGDQGLAHGNWTTKDGTLRLFTQRSLLRIYGTWSHFEIVAYKPEAKPLEVPADRRIVER